MAVAVRGTGGVAIRAGGGCYVKADSAPQVFDYYIGPSGSDSNPGTLASPWSIDSLNTKRATYAGKSIGFLDGTYNVYTQVTGNGAQYSPTFNVAGGSSGSPTILKAVNARQAIITAKNGSTYGGDTSLDERPGIIGSTALGRTISGSFVAGPGNNTYITIDGLVLQGTLHTLLRFGVLDPANGSGLYGPYPGIVIQNCEFSDTDATGASGNPSNPAGINLNDCDAPIIRNNYFLNLRPRAGRGDGVLLWNCANPTIEYNSLENAGGFHNKRGANYALAYGGTVRYNYIDASSFADGSAMLDWTGRYYLPEAGSVLLVENNVFVTAGGCHLDRGDFIQISKGIVGASKATQCVVTLASSGGDPNPAWDFEVGYTFTVSGVGGMTQLNGNTYTVVGSPSNTQLTLNVNSTGFGTYTSGGTGLGPVWDSSTETINVRNNTFVVPSGSDANSSLFFSTLARVTPGNFYNNVCWWESGSPSFGSDVATMYIPNTGFGIIDYNVYTSGTNKWSTFSPPNGAYPDNNYSTLSAWRTATGKEAGSSVSLSSSPFVGTGTAADKYKLSGGSLPVNFGRVGGVSGGATIDAGAWGGASPPTRIGRDWT